MSSRMRRLAGEIVLDRDARLAVLARDQADLTEFGAAVDALGQAATPEETSAAASRLCALYVALRCMALGMEPPP